jgi:hypothetical protein
MNFINGRGKLPDFSKAYDGMYGTANSGGAKMASFDYLTPLLFAHLGI